MTNIIDHVGFSVADFEKSKAFYKAVLGTLGIQMLTDFAHEGDYHAGFGIDAPTFWIGTGKQKRGQVHVAFVARSRSEVEAFHSVALSMGATDNGAPGLRPHYHPGYFGAFVIDPDGNNVEAVFHDQP
jgi:catechol 2,3-dioxygenase-like lactoylglutathione lyase family enzyme